MHTLNSTLQNRHRILRTLGAILLMGLLIGSSATLSLASGALRGRIVLTRRDMALLLAEQSEEVQKKLRSDKSARVSFAKDIRKMLAVAEEARRAGIATRSEQKRQMDYVRARVIAEDYFRTHKEEITDAEIDAQFKEKGVQALFEQLIADGVKQAGQEITAETRVAARKSYGRILIGERRGIAAGVDRRRIVKLNILLQEELILAQTYSTENLLKQTKPTEVEIDAYLASHPDVQDQKDRGQAEAIVRRLRNGEDFATLARQFSIDMTRDKGGDLGWFGRGVMVEEFEAAAFALKPGQVSDVVKTVFGYHIIKLDERRTVNKQGVSEEEVRARHILINSRGSDSFALPKSPRERAREALQAEKLQRIFDEIVKRSSVRIPLDFPVTPLRGNTRVNK